jgi:hypothetical protein
LFQFQNSKLYRRLKTFRTFIAKEVGKAKNEGEERISDTSAYHRSAIGLPLYAHGGSEFVRVAGITGDL